MILDVDVNMDVDLDLNMDMDADVNMDVDGIIPNYIFTKWSQLTYLLRVVCLFQISFVSFQGSFEVNVKSCKTVFIGQNIFSVFLVGQKRRKGCRNIQRRLKNKNNLK